MKKFLALIFSVLLVLALAACTSNDNNGESKDSDESHNMEDMDNESTEENQNSNNHSLQITSTKNVTRIEADELENAAVKVSQMIWPATQEENRPGTVILAPADNWQIALASTDLIHHPNNGPVLFYTSDGLSEETLNEIKRLSPKGNKQGTQVMLMGDGEDLTTNLKEFSVEQIGESDAAEFAATVDSKYAEAAGELPQGVIIVSSEEEAKLFSLVASNWIAHAPEPVLYVTKNEIPQATIEALALRESKANIYVFGPEKVISTEVIDGLKQYGEVIRLLGDTPSQLSIEFAKFKDLNTGFGWGFTEPGHGFSLISTNNSEFAIAGAPFAHLGKHAPLIWLENGELSSETHEFLGALQPKFEDDPTVGPYNHAYILGSIEEVTMKTQGMIDQMLEISPKDASGGHAH
ncbi:cell wall-binding repeat-containing protein [Cytobacillus sp. FJAT-54145]|uniref:Cell wall-binding repeat-containing protein n=1 Tax=Cytobacillus spartinae TaxID=3299023 RepID=A0ABW6KK03_9BACI